MDDLTGGIVDQEIIENLDLHISNERKKLIGFQRSYLSALGVLPKAVAKKNPNVIKIRAEMVITQRIVNQLQAEWDDLAEVPENFIKIAKQNFKEVRHYEPNKQIR